MWTGANTMQLAVTGIHTFIDTAHLNNKLSKQVMGKSRADRCLERPLAAAARQVPATCRAGPPTCADGASASKLKNALTRAA